MSYESGFSYQSNKILTSDTSNVYNDQLCEKRPTKYAYDFHFNFYCLNTDGTPNENWNKAVANRAFRRCFQEGLNLYLLHIWMVALSSAEVLLAMMKRCV